MFERFPCDAIYALHNAPGLPVGMAVVQPGPQGGSSDRVTVTFNVAPVDAGVISVGQIEAGTTYNIIPETATLKLSVRATVPEVRKSLEQRIREVVTHQAASCGVSVDIEYQHLVPAICNTTAEAAIARAAVASVLGNDKVLQVPHPRRWAARILRGCWRRCPAATSCSAMARGNGWDARSTTMATTSTMP